LTLGLLDCASVVDFVSGHSAIRAAWQAARKGSWGLGGIGRAAGMGTKIRQAKNFG